MTMVKGPIPHKPVAKLPLMMWLQLGQTQCLYKKYLVVRTSELSCMELESILSRDGMCRCCGCRMMQVCADAVQNADAVDEHWPHPDDHAGISADHALAHAVQPDGAVSSRIPDQGEWLKPRIGVLRDAFFRLHGPRDVDVSVVVVTVQHL